MKTYAVEIVAKTTLLVNANSKQGARRFVEKSFEERALSLDDLEIEMTVCDRR